MCKPSFNMEPDLILLQTDVATLDCCGLIAQLKGNEASAPIKIVLLAHGGPLERSRALDLGADDVLSIPFESAELFARIRAQLREKAPDDRLRSEVLDAKRKGARGGSGAGRNRYRKKSGKKRWWALWVGDRACPLSARVLLFEMRRSVASRMPGWPCRWRNFTQRY